MHTKNIVVYVDQEALIEYFFYLPKKMANKNLIFSRQLSNFLTYDAEIHKIAVFIIPFCPDEQWWRRINCSFDNADHTYIFCDELHPHTLKLLVNLDRPNTTFFISGIINYRLKFAAQKLWMSYWKHPCYFYSKVKPNLLEEKLKSDNKNMYFDFLNGTRRSHKDFAYNYIKTNGLENKGFITYQGIVRDNYNDTSHIFDSEGIDGTYNDSSVFYYGHFMLRSSIVPYTIYNKSFYSLIAETNASNHFNFYTEKIVKPLIAGRLFIVIAGKDYLKNLRKLGFKTFSTVIDETYDDEPDNFRRWSKAMDQMLYLTKQDPNKIYNQIQEELIHNKNLMLQTNWLDIISTQIQQDIDCKVVG